MDILQGQLEASGVSAGNFGKDREFNPKKHYLGRICKNGHNWQDTGHSIRFIKTRTCLDCSLERVKSRYYASEKAVRAERRQQKKQGKIEKLGKEAIAYGFNPKVFFLGSLCIHGHEWQDSGQSLRRVRDYSCEECRRVKRETAKKAGRQQREEETVLKLNLLVSNGFDPKKFYLSVLCASGHAWQGTQYSLRRTNGRACLECERDRRIEYQKNMPESVRKARRENSKRYYYSNKDYFREWAKFYQKTPNGKRIADKARGKRRAVKNDALHIPYSKQEFQSKIEFFKYKCAYCGKSGETLTMDHFVPLSKGGMDAIHNLIPACQSCNSSKKASEVESWYRKQSFFSENRWARILKSLGKTKKNYQQISLL